MLELGVSTLCDQQRLHRQSGVIDGKDRDCVEESNKVGLGWCRKDAMGGGMLDGS